MKAWVATFSALLVASCGSEDSNKDSTNCANDSGSYPPAGSNQILRAPVTIADGLEVIISDVVIPPNTTVPRHYHPGEEFMYVLDGAATHVEEGKPDQLLRSGDAYVIPPRAIHAPRSGPCGGRAVLFRLHVEGKEERVLVPE